jgi:hypothetical protein
VECWTKVQHSDCYCRIATVVRHTVMHPNHIWGYHVLQRAISWQKGVWMSGGGTLCASSRLVVGLTLGHNHQLHSHAVLPI